MTVSTDTCTKPLYNLEVYDAQDGYWSNKKTNWSNRAYRVKTWYNRAERLKVPCKVAQRIVFLAGSLNRKWLHFEDVDVCAMEMRLLVAQKEYGKLRLPFPIQFPLKTLLPQVSF